MFSNILNKGKASVTTTATNLAVSSSSSSSSSVVACETSLTINDRKKGALFGLFVADSVAMPVHWYYDRRQLVEVLMYCYYYYYHDIYTILQ